MQRIVVTLLMAFLVGCGPDPGVKYVVIDSKEAAVVVFTPAPLSASETLLKRVVAEAATPGTVRYVTWADFPASIRGEAEKVIVRNDFPDADIPRGLACVMAKAPGQWGITWNGGIALTRNDYEFARGSFSAKAPASGPSPVDPKVHFGSFGCL